MSLTFTESTSNYYSIDSADLPAVTSNDWAVGVMFKLDSTVTGDGMVLSLGDDTDAGRLRIYTTYSDDRLYFDIHGTTRYYSSFRATYGDEWVFLTVQRRSSDGYYSSKLLPVGSNSSTEPTWYALASSEKPSGLNHYIGAGYSGSAYNKPFKGLIGEVVFAEGGPALDVGDLSDISKVKSHFIEKLGEDNIIYFLNLADAAATETDIVNSVDATKTGTVTAGENPQDTDGTEEMFPRLATTPAYSVTSEASTDLSGDSWTFGLMVKLPATPTEDIPIFDTANAWSASDSGLRVFYSHADTGIKFEYRNGTSNVSSWVGTSDFAGRWGFFGLRRETGTLYRKYRKVIDSDTLGTASSTLDTVTYGNFSGEDFVFYANTARRPSAESADIAQCFLVEDILSDTEIDNICLGTNYVTDYVTDANLKWYFQFATLNATEYSLTTDRVEAIKNGTISSFTHPVTAQAEPVFGSVAGSFSPLTGALVGEYVYSGDFSENLPSLTGAFAGEQAFTTMTGDVSGTFPMLTGALEGIFGNQGGDVDGDFSALTGGFIASLPDVLGGVFPALEGALEGISGATIDGTFPPLFGVSLGFVQLDDYFDGGFPVLSGSFEALSTDHMVREALQVDSAAIVVALGRTVIESLVASDYNTTTINATNQVIESLLTLAQVSIQFRIDNVEAANLTVSNTVAATMSEAVIEAMSLLVILTAQSSVTVTNEEIASVLDELALSYSVFVTELLDITSATANNATLHEVVTATVSVSKAQSVFAAFTELLAEELSADDVQAVTASLTNTVLEAANTEIYVELEDDLYQALVLNTETNAPWMYNNYPFNSFNGKLAAGSDGIYSLEGLDDAGTDIDAEFETGFSDFGTPFLKRLPQGGVYFGLANDGNVIIKTVTSRSGTVEEDWYEQDATLTAFDTTRMKVHDGLKARYWKFKVSNKDGSNIDVDSLQIYPIALKRRIR